MLGDVLSSRRFVRRRFVCASCPLFRPIVASAVGHSYFLFGFHVYFLVIIKYSRDYPHSAKQILIGIEQEG